MRIVYRILAFVIAAEVAVQAAVMVWAIAGLGIWVDDGGVLDKSVMESEDGAFPETAGFGIHWFNGTMIIPVLALLLLVFSFFAKVHRGVALALVILGLVALQIFLGLLGHEWSFLGILHGINAFALLGVSIRAGLNARPAAAPSMAAYEAP
jgi:hypothetical protein